jgi:glycosyltransferase involved in cell wall biosynthesis
LVSKSPLVAVVVPIHNIEDYLEQCLETVRNQTYCNWVCILVNDFSTDGSVEIIKKYINLDSRFVQVNTNFEAHENESLAETVTMDPEKNGAEKRNILNKDAPSLTKNQTTPKLEAQGLPVARKFGANEARKFGANFLLFIDGDDWVELDCLSDLMHSALKTNSEIVYSGFYWDYPKKSIVDYSSLGVVGQYNSQNNCLIDILIPRPKGWGGLPAHVSVWGVLYKIDLFNDIDWDYNNIQMGEDLRLHIQILLKTNKVSNLAKPLYHYRQSNQSMTFNLAKPSTDILDFLISLNSKFPEIDSDLCRRFERIWLKGWILYLARQTPGKISKFLKESFPHHKYLLSSIGVEFSKTEKLILFSLKLFPTLSSRIVVTSWQLMKTFQARKWKN